MRMADPHLNVHRILAQGRVRIQRARVFVRLGVRSVWDLAFRNFDRRRSALGIQGLTGRLE